MTAVYASVDLGGTNIKCAFGNESGEILSSDSTPTLSHLGPPAVLERIAGLVLALSEKVGSKPAALGMGCPGLVDILRISRSNRPNLATTLEHWAELPWP